MKKLAPCIKLNNGNEMPMFGLGTYMAKEGECEQAVKDAINAGYRHIDTAYYYLNEKEVGAAVRAKIAEGVVKREDLFIATKLWNTFHAPELVEKACRASIENLGVGPLDLYLIHMPMGYEFHGWDAESLNPKDHAGNLYFSDVDYLDTWKKMEKCLTLGLTKNIGVSNFNSQQIKRLVENSQIKPVTNQVECCPNLNQKKLIEFCKTWGIVLTSYGPLGRPHFAAKDPNGPQPPLFHPRVKALSEKYNKTPAQITLRYLLDIGTVPIPKSSNNQRIQENFDVFDFQLSSDDIASMDTLQSGARMVSFPYCSTHKHYPFHIEF